MNNNTVGKVTDIQHFSVHDGPGIRTTVFLKGCFLRCAWCHNPEAQDGNDELMFNENKCVGCGACVSACSQNVHSFSDEKHLIDRSKCVRCFKCADACVFSALEKVGRDLTVDEVMKEILADEVFYRHSKGGMTVSGGEPLFQPQFTLELLKACRSSSVSTCIETSGYGSEEMLLKMTEYTDLFLFDYKLTDDEMHKKYTGVSVLPILDNLRKLSDKKANIILRCPMIPNVNMVTSHYDGIAKVANENDSIKEIQLEPYHPLGIRKTYALGHEPAFDKQDFLDKKELVEVRDYLSEKTVVPVRIV